MKSKPHSNSGKKRSDFDRNDADAHFGKGLKKDRGGKKRLSIYDEFNDEELEDLSYKQKDINEDDEDDE